MDRTVILTDKHSHSRLFLASLTQHTEWHWPGVVSASLEHMGFRVVAVVSMSLS